MMNCALRIVGTCDILKTERDERGFDLEADMSSENRGATGLKLANKSPAFRLLGNRNATKVVSRRELRWKKRIESEGRGPIGNKSTNFVNFFGRWWAGRASRL